MLAIDMTARIFERGKVMYNFQNLFLIDSHGNGTAFCSDFGD